MAEMLMVAELTCHTLLADVKSVNLQQHLPQPHADRIHPCQHTNVNYRTEETHIQQNLSKMKSGLN